jgi:hypothetical protein
LPTYSVHGFKGTSSKFNLDIGPVIFFNFFTSVENSSD